MSDKPLNPNQLRFVEEYLCDQSSATAAAIRAGYSIKSAKSIAKELMKDERIKDAIEVGQANLRKKIGVTAERIIQELAMIAYAKPGDTIKLTGDGDYEANIDTPIRKEQETGGSPSEVLVSTVVDKKGNKSKAVTIKTVKLSDKIAALEKLGKFLGLFKDQVEVKGNLTLAELVEKSMKEEASAVTEGS